MASKKASRRKFLKAGAAAAAISAVQSAAVPAALAQAQPQKSLKELVAYGDRPKFITSIRVPIVYRPPSDHVCLIFHLLTPLQDQAGH